LGACACAAGSPSENNGIVIDTGDFVCNIAYLLKIEPFLRQRILDEGLK
jgi:hypothetical protein